VFVQIYDKDFAICTRNRKSKKCYYCRFESYWACFKNSVL